MNDLTVNSVSKGQVLGITQQGQVNLCQAIQSAVTVGRHDIVGCIVHHIAGCVIVSAGIGVEAQDPFDAQQVSPHNVVMLVTLGDAAAGAPEGVIVPVSGIENGSVGPITVEAQVGQVQLAGNNALIVGGSQVDKAFHIAAVFPVSLKVFLVAVSQLHGNLNIGLTASGNSNGILVKGHGTIQGNIEASHEVLVFSCRKLHTGNIFRVQSCGQIIGHSLITDVMNLEGEGVLTVGVVTHADLGHFAADSQIGFSGNCFIGIHQASTLLTGRCLNIVSNNGICGGHHHSLSQITDGAVRCVGVQFLQMLHHQSSDTGNLGSGHGGTGHIAVGTAIVAGVDITANTGDVRLQTQVGSNTPAGEGAHLAGGSRVNNSLLLRNDHGLVLGCLHVSAVAQGDQASRDAGIVSITVCIGHFHRNVEIQNIGVIGVPDQAGNCAGHLCIFDLCTKVDGTTGNNGNLACDQAVALFIIEVFLIAQTVNDHILQFLANQGIHTGNIAIVPFGRVVEHNLGAVGQLDVVGIDLCILSGCDGECVDIGGRRTDGSIVGVLGTVQVSAPQVLSGAGAFVTGGNGGNDVLRVQTLIDQVDLGIAGGETGDRTQGQVDNITTQSHGIFQSCHDVVGISAACSTEDLHDDQLCIGSHTHNIGTLSSIRSGNTGNMSTVIALRVSGVVSSQVVVNIVECVRNLVAVIQLLSGDGGVLCVSIQFLQNSGNIRSGHGILGQLRSSRKGRMIQIQTGVDDRDLHALTGVTKILPNLSNTSHLASGEGVGSSSIGGDSVVNRHDVDSLDVVQLSNLFQILKFGLDGESIGQVSKLVTDSQLHALQNLLLDLFDDLVLNLQQIFLGCGSNSGHGVVRLRQRGLFHNDERGNTVAVCKDLSSLLQFLDGFRNLRHSQINGRSGIGFGYIPITSAVNIFRGFDGRLHKLLVTQGGNAITLYILALDNQITGNRGIYFVCFINNRYSVHDAVFGSSRCVDCGRKHRNQHTQSQKHRQ